MAGVQRMSQSLVDPDSVSQALSGSFPGLRLGRVDPATFRVAFDVAATDHFSLFRMDWQASAAADTGVDDLTVITSAGSGYRIGAGRDDVDPRRPYLVPPEGFVASWEAHRSTIATLDTAAVERIARDASGNGELRLRRTGTAPLTPQLGVYWAMVVRGIRDSVSSAPGVFASPLVERAAFHQLATAFLHVFPTNWLDQADEDPGGSGVVRRAIEFMRAHAGDAITVTDVAVAAFVSTRGLHAAFTRERGEAPGQYLRRLRIDGARADLLAADPGTTIAEVAHRWGFAHLPRFAEGYRREFDENPSETLRR